MLLVNLRQMVPLGIGICSVLNGLICLTALAGWWLNEPILASWLPGWPTMKTVTAVGMMTTGIAILFFAASRWPEWRRWRPFLSSMSLVMTLGPLAISIWTLMHINIHGVPTRLGVLSGGDMHALPAPVTAISLLLFGLALLTVHLPRWFGFFCFCVGLAAALCWLALVSLAYCGGPNLPKSMFGTVSLPSAIAMLVICSGLALLRPQEGVMRIVLSKRSSGRLVRQLLPVTLSVTFFFGLLRVIAQHQWGFSTEIGVAFYSTITMIVLVLVILRYAMVSDRLDCLRERSEKRMVRSLDKTKAALIQAQGFLEAAPGGMVVVDGHGKILLVNSQMHSLFGYTQEELLNQDMESLLPDLFHTLQVESQEAFFQHPELYRMQGGLDLSARHKDGSTFAAEVTLSPMETLEGAVLIASIRDITKRRTAEKALEENERRFRGIFNSTFQFIGLLTPEGVLMETNQPSLDAVGMKASEVIGKYFWDCPWFAHSTEDQERIKECIQRAAKGEAMRFQKCYFQPDGTRRDMDFSITPVRGESGEVLFLVPEARDITEVLEEQSRQLAKEKLYQQEIELNQKRLQLATQAGGIGIWDWDIQTNHLVWDEQMRRIYQMPHQDASLLYADWESRVHRDDLPGANQMLEEAFAGKREYKDTFRILWPDGSTHYIQAKALIQRDAEGKPVRMLGTNADITKRVMAEARLQESEERFRHAFEYSAIGFALLDPDGTWLAVNRAICDIVGYSEEELKTKTFQDITHPDDLDADLENVGRLIRGEITHFQMEKRYIRKNGSTVWCLLTASLMKEEDGSPAYFISQVEDITQRHEAERVLKYQQEQLRMFIEHTPAAVAMFDLDMCYVAASRRWVEDYKLESENVLGRSHYEIFPEIGEDWKSLHRRSLAGSVVHRDEDMFVRQDGHEEWLRWEIRPWMDLAGKIGGIVMFTEVITERKNAAEKVRASLEEKEVLLREIHHRVKNNMQIISSLLQLQTSTLHDPADVAIFQDCQARIHAMAMVHDRLYRSGNLSTINFGEHLRELASLMARGQGTYTRLVCLETTCDDVELDLDKAIPLGLIATELITNAYKHAFKDRTEGSIHVLLQKVGDRMTLRVSDDGPGLPDAANPGTAKTLGLRLVRSLSRQLRGQILFRSDYVGCCVEITFTV